MGQWARSDASLSSSLILQFGHPSLAEVRALLAGYMPAIEPIELIRHWVVYRVVVMRLFYLHQQTSCGRER